MYLNTRLKLWCLNSCCFKIIVLHWDDLFPIYMYKLCKYIKFLFQLSMIHYTHHIQLQYLIYFEIYYHYNSLNCRVKVSFVHRFIYFPSHLIGSAVFISTSNLRGLFSKGNKKNIDKNGKERNQLIPPIAERQVETR